MSLSLDSCNPCVSPRRLQTYDSINDITSIQPTPSFVIDEVPLLYFVSLVKPTKALPDLITKHNVCLTNRKLVAKSLTRFKIPAHVMLSITLLSLGQRPKYFFTIQYSSRTFAHSSESKFPNSSKELSQSSFICSRCFFYTYIL